MTRLPENWNLSLDKAKEHGDTTKIVIDIINEESEVIDEQKLREDAYREKVINIFFEYGKLKAIPAQRKKQRICLEEIARAFEFNKEYDEKEVNEIIQKFHDDFCTIRRDMISEHIMERDGNVYRLK